MVRLNIKSTKEIIDYQRGLVSTGRSIERQLNKKWVSIITLEDWIDEQRQSLRNNKDMVKKLSPEYILNKLDEDLKY